MVTNTRKTPGVEACQPVNLPEPITVEVDASGNPTAVRMPRRHPVTSTEDRWRIDDEWWRSEPVSRLYYALILKSGQKLVIYKDLVSGHWYRQSI